jgi:hypothetical protein
MPSIWSSILPIACEMSCSDCYSHSRFLAQQISKDSDNSLPVMTRLPFSEQQVSLVQASGESDLTGRINPPRLSSKAIQQPEHLIQSLRTEFTATCFQEVLCSLANVLGPLAKRLRSPQFIDQHQVYELWRACHTCFILLISRPDLWQFLRWCKCHISYLVFLIYIEILHIIYFFGNNSSEGRISLA